jgi:hypothetical protein
MFINPIIMPNTFIGIIACNCTANITGDILPLALFS